MFTTKRFLGIVWVAAAVGFCWAAGARSLAQPAGKAAASLAKRYKIKIDRPEKVGQTYKVTSSGVGKTKTMHPDSGQTSQPQLKGFEIKCLRKVLEADANGQATKCALTLQSCVTSLGQEKEQTLPVGTVVIITKGEGQRPDIESKDPNVTLSRKAKSVLLVAIYTPFGPLTENFDSWLGTDKPRKLGESWPIHSKAAIERIKKESHGRIVFKDGDITGRVTLMSLTKVAGIQCMVLRAELTLQPPTVNGNDSGRGPTTLTVTLDLPLDESIPMVGRKIKSFSDFRAQSVPGGDKDASVRTELTINTQSIPVGK